MHQLVGSFIVGTLAGGGTRKIEWRPLAVQAVKQGIRLGRGVQNVSSQVRAEIEQIVAEAKAELDADRMDGTEYRES